jgi:hypothetical protein
MSAGIKRGTSEQTEGVSATLHVGGGRTSPAGDCSPCPSRVAAAASSAWLLPPAPAPPDPHPDSGKWPPAQANCNMSFLWHCYTQLVSLSLLQSVLQKSLWSTEINPNGSNNWSRLVWLPSCQHVCEALLAAWYCATARQRPLNKKEYGGHCHC